MPTGPDHNQNSMFDGEPHPVARGNWPSGTGGKKRKKEELVKGQAVRKLKEDKKIK